MSTGFFRCLNAAILLFLAVESASANTFTVTSLGDSGTGSLRDAITASRNGDTINFAVTGTITLTSNRLYIDHFLIIQGPGASNLTITRSSSASNFRIFDVEAPLGISGLTIMNGNLAGVDTLGGGAIYGIAEMTVTSCVFVNNNGALQGGAISYSVFGQSHELTLDSCVFTNNYGDFGGAVSSFADGTSDFHGSATLRVINCTFLNNLANEGGAIRADRGSNGQSTVTVTGSTFGSNDCESVGGGIFSHSVSLTVNNSTFSGNGRLDASAGGIWHGGATATATIENCTFSGNTGTDAGGIYLSGGTLTLGSTILKTGSSGANLVNNGGTITSEGFNLSNDAAGGDGLTGPGGFLNAGGDIRNTDPKLDPYGLQDNGGPTQTIALLFGSPAIDKGNSFGSTTDQRGNPRPVDNPTVANASDGTDIGAYESPADPVQDGPPWVVNTLNDHDDGVCGAADCTLREAVARANARSTNTNPQTITFAPGLKGTIVLGGTDFDQLNITGRLTITGPGARVLAVSGNNTHRIFAFDTTANRCTISGLTIENGNYAPSTDNHGEIHQGSAIFSFSGGLTLEDCAFINNVATGASNIASAGVGGTGQGGAIFNRGTLKLNRCTFSGNAANGAAGSALSSGGTLGPGGDGGAGQGGAVFNHGSGSLAVYNCTFSGNTATGGAGGAGSGGTLQAAGGDGNGAAVFNQGTMTLTSATVSGNTGRGGAGYGSGAMHGPNGGSNGGVFAASGSSDTVANTIVAGNIGNAADTQGAFTSSGYNLIGIGDFSSGFTTTGDLVGTTAAPIDAKLSPLQNHGGPTDTMAPLAGSPAIDQGNNFGLPFDQRSQPRPFDDPSYPNATGGDGCDIGAVEINLQTGIIFTVTTTDDHDDGVCSQTDCTLREAINATNSDEGLNTINFAPSVTGSISLQANLGTLNVNGDTIITGPGARSLTVSGNTAIRVFQVNTGSSTMSGLTIRDGTYNAPSSGGAAGFGGGIYNQATLTLNDCAVINNTANGATNSVVGGAGGAGAGGGVFNGGSLTLNRCTIGFNKANGAAGNSRTFGAGSGGAGGAAQGSGVYNNGRLVVNNCTFFANNAKGGAGGSGSGGGIGGAGGNANGTVFNANDSFVPGNMTITSATVYGNRGTGGAGGGTGSTMGPAGSSNGGLSAASGGSSTVANTIVATNGSADDVEGAFTSSGYNFIDDGDFGTGFTATGDQVGTTASPISPQ